jgi:hypothetical protein
VLAPTGPNEGDAYVDWDPIYPTPAYDKYEWTLTVKQLPLTTGSYYFWALQNGFIGSADAFYFGLQPYGSCPGGGFCRMALFSFFGNGASSTSPNCVSGADNGPGESCHVAYNWSVGTAYRFLMKLVSANSTTEEWSATVTDTVAKVTTAIGNWTIPASEGLVGTQGIGFTEYYEPNTTCAAQPLAIVKESVPTGFSNGTAYPGSVRGTQAGSYCTGYTHFTVYANYVIVKTGHAT